jgi:hypothetical protein
VQTPYDCPETGWQVAVPHWLSAAFWSQIGREVAQTRAHTPSPPCTGRHCGFAVTATGLSCGQAPLQKLPGTPTMLSSTSSELAEGRRRRCWFDSPSAHSESNRSARKSGSRSHSPDRRLATPNRFARSVGATLSVCCLLVLRYRRKRASQCAMRNTTN